MSQPVMLRRRALRYGIGVMLILASVYLYLNVITGARTADPGDFRSAGYISATMHKQDGDIAVLIAPDGKIIEAPGYSDGAADQPPIWSADGQRLYFASDRENGESHVFRWNPAQNKVERKTIDKRTKSAISMSVPGTGKPSASMLVVSGGTVIELDPKTNSTRQVLPPKKGTSQGSAEEGAQSQFDQFYAALGTSFKVAKWGRDKAFIISIMRRDEGEIMICQDQSNFSKPPTIVIAGDKIDFDVSPVDGTVVYTCQKFQFPSPQMVPPQLKKNGKVEYPFRHIIGLFRPGDGGMYEESQTATGMIAVTQDDKFCFGVPCISPDGNEVLSVVGPYEGFGMMQANNLVVMPVRIGGGQQSETLVPHRVYDANWHPNGQSVVFTGESGGRQGVYTINRDKTGMKSVTGDKGSFRGATFSPASK